MSWDTDLDMADEGARAGQSRARAEELRAVAQWMKDLHAVKQVLATALEYERMAQTIEKFARSGDRNRARGKPQHA